MTTETMAGYVGDDQPMRLEEACDTILPGRLTRKALRREIDGRKTEHPRIPSQECKRYVAAIEEASDEDVDKVFEGGAGGACAMSFKAEASNGGVRR